MTDKATIFFAGDFCSTPSTLPIKVSDELKGLIFSSDFAVCNFEVPLKPNDVPAQKDRYYQADDAPAFLESLGFNVISFANNHAFDYGVEGWQKTMNSFQNEPFGSGKYEDAYKIKIIEKKGIKIGFLALCYAARFGVFDNLSDREGYACAWINDHIVNHIIIKAKKDVDYLIILPHDGIEYIDIPMPEIIIRYHDFIDYGADAVIGTHPHCPQGWEIYEGKPIFYSLGNFLFNSKTDYHYRAANRPHWYEGLCVILEFKGKQTQIIKVINTKNKDNIAIEIDNSVERLSHNANLCDYFKNSQKYNNILSQECKRLSLIQEAPIIDCTFPGGNLFSAFKQIIKCLTRIVLKRKQPDNSSLKNLLKNDTRRNVLLRGI